MNASNKLQHKSAFSLIETTIAMGILAIALSCFLAALPQVFSARNTVEHETRAGLIAQNLLSEICVFGRLGTNTGFPPPMTSGSATTCLISLNQQGELLRVLNPDSFTNGSPDAAYLALIRTASSHSLPGLAELEISIEWPGCAAAHTRKHRLYHTLILCH